MHMKMDVHFHVHTLEIDANEGHIDCYMYAHSNGRR